MDKKLVLEIIQEKGLVAVIRAGSAIEAEKITEACVVGGAAAIELTFTVPHAEEVISALSKRYEGTDVLIGAGTVMDAETAALAVNSGANYIVSPFFDEATMAFCNKAGVAMMPGIMTVREAVLAKRAGAEILKAFPGDVLGPQFIRSVLGPLPDLKIMPTGGVTADNVGEWIGAGAVAVGAGGSLTAGAKTGDYQKITDTARKFVANIREARAALK